MGSISRGFRNVSDFPYGSIVKVDAQGLPGHIGEKNIIKRVIGVAGDRIEIRDGKVFRNGVAHNDDLQAKSPLLRVTGAGDIDIGAGTMNYTAKAALVATSTGQGGKERTDVAGITAPVQITGPFDNLKYSVDVAALATDVAKEALARELERRLGGGQAGEGSEKKPGRTRDALRGLFGR